MNVLIKMNVTLPIWVRLIFKSRTKNQQTKIQKLMKTTFSIIVTFLGLQSSLLFANGSSAQTSYSDLMIYPSFEAVNASPASEISEAELKELAPVLPIEADFNDNDLITLSSSSLVVSASLAPAIPTEADFNDSDAGNLNSLLPYLAPSVPVEADFQDNDTMVNQDSSNLAPGSPSEATFDDIV